jgi:hypothetical protein
VHDLASESTTPNFSLVVPNLCNDGHDPSATDPNEHGTCEGPDATSGSTSGVGGLVSVDNWLSRYVPAIMASPAFRHDGMLVITFDEGGGTPNPNDPAYAASCCSEPQGETQGRGSQGTNGVTGSGGGKVGALVLSPYVNPGTTTSSLEYNHFSLLRSIQDLLGATHGLPGQAPNNNSGYLGYAGAISANSYPGPCDVGSNGSCTGPLEFGKEVFTNPAGTANPLAAPGGATGVVPGVHLGANVVDSSGTVSGAVPGDAGSSATDGVAPAGGTASGSGQTVDTPTSPSAPAAALTGSLLGPSLPQTGGSPGLVWASILVALAAVAAAVIRPGRRST